MIEKSSHKSTKNQSNHTIFEPIIHIVQVVVYGQKFSAWKARCKQNQPRKSNLKRFVFETIISMQERRFVAHMLVPPSLALAKFKNLQSRRQG